MARILFILFWATIVFGPLAILILIFGWTWAPFLILGFCALLAMGVFFLGAGPEGKE